MKKLSFILLITVLLGSCKKEFSDNFVPYPNLGLNDTIWNNKPLTGGFIDSISNAINKNNGWLVDSFNLASEKKFKYYDNLEILFPAHSYSIANNNSIPIQDGMIKFELLPLLKKGDYIKYLIPTTSKNYLLESPGSFLIKLSWRGQDVDMLQNTAFNIRWRDDNPKTNMKFFEGFPIPNRDSLFTWLPQLIDGYVTTWDSTSFGVSKKGYQITSKSTDWISSSNFLDTTQTTRLNVTLPLNYTNKNSFVFAVYNNKNTVVRLTTDFATRSFYCLKVPVNSSITLISISLIDNEFYWGTRSVNVTNADRLTVSPIKTSVANIINALDNL
jgi:hypothetical protein